MKENIKHLLPAFLRAAIGKIMRLFIYSNYDSSAYWIGRAKEPGQAAVLWKNQEYNELYRKLQEEILFPFIKTLKPNAKVLDIGCGIGIVSDMLLTINNDIKIDAVDFSEMILIAKNRFTKKNINYISSSAENFLGEVNNYDIVLSSGCYSAIRDIDRLEQAMLNGASMLKVGGKMIMIDPFHRWNYLARAKYNTRYVVQLLNSQNLVLEVKSGVLFWPFREWLANSNYSNAALSNRFYFGEKLLKLFGQHFWADYKVLVFTKIK